MDYPLSIKLSKCAMAFFYLGALVEKYAAVNLSLEAVRILLSSTF